MSAYIMKVYDNSRFNFDAFKKMWRKFDNDKCIKAKRESDMAMSLSVDIESMIIKYPLTYIGCLVNGQIFDQIIAVGSELTSISNMKKCYIRYSNGAKYLYDDGGLIPEIRIQFNGDNENFIFENFQIVYKNENKINITR